VPNSFFYSLIGSIVEVVITLLWLVRWPKPCRFGGGR